MTRLDALRGLLQQLLCRLFGHKLFWHEAPTPRLYTSDTLTCFGWSECERCLHVNPKHDLEFDCGDEPARNLSMPYNPRHHAQHSPTSQASPHSSHKELP
jgi:hypothetical protein